MSQILRYAVWAKGIGYDDLNEAYGKLIKDDDHDEADGVPGGRPGDLHDAVKNRFGSVPQRFNPGQRLYIVGRGNRAEDGRRMHVPLPERAQDKVRQCGVLQ